MGEANMMKLSDYLSLAGLELHAERAKALEAELELAEEKANWKADYDKELRRMDKELAKAKQRVRELESRVDVYKGALHEACVDIAALAALKEADKEVSDG